MDKKGFLLSRTFIIIGVLLSAALLLGFSPSRADSVAKKVEEANQLYEKGLYDEALKKYLDAQIINPDDLRVSFNLGNAQYKKNNYEDALQSYLRSSSKTDTAEEVGVKEKALYNMGNSLYRMGKPEEACSFYEKALELNPDDIDAKYNLEFVRHKIQEMQQQNQQNQPSSSQNEDQNQKSSQQQQSQSDSDKEKEKNSSPPSPQGGNPQEQKQQAKKDQRSSTMSKEEAMRWLDSLKEENSDALKKWIKKQLGPEQLTDKDW